MTASSDNLGSRPAPVRKVVLPEVAGLQLDDARVVLTSAGLDHVRVHYVEAYADEFSVVEQIPHPGMLVDRTREITLHVARTNMLAYLPQVYQQSSPGFLKGYLYIVQTIFDRLYQRLDHIHELFDPRTTDPEFLPWLASWLAVGLNRDWTDLQTRKMLLAATRLFPYRGTSRAISEFVRIYTGASVTIEENSWPFRGFRVGVHSTVGEDTVILPDMNLAHCFVVRLDRPAAVVSEDEIIRIHEIIQAQKPAHTSYFLAFSDEAESGEMGMFMEIGTSSIGMGMGIGMGVGAADVVAMSTSDGE